MAGSARRSICRRGCGAALVLLVLPGAGPGAALPAPTLQEMRLVGRVLHFQTTQPSGQVTLAVVYSAAQPGSREEASAVAALLGDGLAAGDLTLRPVLVEQAQLATLAGYDAVFCTIGVDEGLLAAALRRHNVPCLTRHIEQVESGICTVAIAVAPSVSIVLSMQNAAAAGVQFATAFRMMVHEI